MKKIKVLHISPDGAVNGTERHILSLVYNCNREIIDPWVAVPIRGLLTRRLDELNINYEIAGRIPGFKYSGFFKNNGTRNLIKLIRREKFDIVHSHLVSYGCFIAKIFGVKRTVHTRHGIFWTDDEIRDMSFVTKRFQKLKSEVIDLTIALSNQEKETMVEKFGYDPAKIKKIYNGVSIADVNSKINEKLTKKDLFGTDRFTIGAVGRLERQKNFSLLVDVAEKVVKSNNNVKFVIVGEGSLKDDLLKKISDLNLNDNVELVGYKENVYDYISRFDVLLQTSLWEGMPYVLLEAMALGIPIISTTSEKLSGVSELIVDGETGILVKEPYLDKLVSSILEIIKNENLRNMYSENAKERTKNYFSEKMTVSETEKCYTELMNSK